MAPVNPKVLESLNLGISSEIKSYVFYKEAAQKTANENIKNALLQLAGEEKEHYQVLERQHHSLILPNNGSVTTISSNRKACWNLTKTWPKLTGNSSSRSTKPLPSGKFWKSLWDWKRRPTVYSPRLPRGRPTLRK
ncbi:MAG: hypothetical protein GY841_19785 [FCB group bacterium]|nr:hypothetical protein [FCB group bacterium]